MKDAEEVLLARGQATSPFGKCTEEIKSKLPFEIKESFTRIAHDAGMTESEYLREMIMIKVLGLDMVRKIHAERLERVAGIGPQ